MSDVGGLGSTTYPVPEYPDELINKVEQMEELFASGYNLPENMDWPAEESVAGESYGEGELPPGENGALEQSSEADELGSKLAEAFATVGRSFAEAEQLRREYNRSRGHFPVTGKAGGKQGSSGGNQASHRQANGGKLGLTRTFNGGKSGGQFQGNCILCGKWGHRARDCRNRGGKGSMAQREGTFNAFMHGVPLFFNETEYNIYQYEEDKDFQQATLWPAFTGFCLADYRRLGILDGGASQSAGGFMALQDVQDDHLDAGIELPVKQAAVDFTFAGGSGTRAVTRVEIPFQGSGESAESFLSINVVPTPATPILIGVDMLDRFGLVLDYKYSTVFSHALKRFLPAKRTVGGHLALLLSPEE